MNLYYKFENIFDGAERKRYVIHTKYWLQIFRIKIQAWKDFDWVVQVWKDFDKSGIVKKAQKLGMTPELGPEIEGYVDQHFQDEQPDGEEVEVADPEFEEELTA